MGIEEDLEREIAKWSGKLEKEMKAVKENERNEGFAKNIRAYMKDSKYFHEKGDLIRSFEALIWAWAYLEICREMKIID